MRNFIEIVAEYPPENLCTYPEYKGKPYYSIHYQENGEDFMGYGTYNPEVLSRYIKEYFLPAPKIEVLQEIRQEIENIPLTDNDGHTSNWIREPQHIKQDALNIIDSKIEEKAVEKDEPVC